MPLKLMLVHEMTLGVQMCSREELEEVMKLVKPQHFLPVHGEYAFLCAHAQLARDIGIRDTSVIRNGQYLGVSPRRNGKTISTGSMQLLGEAKLQMFYNDGGRVRALLLYILALLPRSLMQRVWGVQPCSFHNIVADIHQITLQVGKQHQMSSMVRRR